MTMKADVVMTAGLTEIMTEDITRGDNPLVYRKTKGII